MDRLEHRFSHQGGKETLMRPSQGGDGYCAAVRQSQILSAGGTEADRMDPGSFGDPGEDHMIGYCDDVAGLILAKPERMAGDVPRMRRQAGPDATRHFRHSDQNATIRNVVAGSNSTVEDMGADKVAVAAFSGEIDRWWCAVL